MNYEKCLRSAFIDFESWAIALVAVAISFIIWKFGSRVFAFVCLGVGLLLAVFWARQYYELNCVELFGL
jgi:hypothetical protein